MSKKGFFRQAKFGQIRDHAKPRELCPPAENLCPPAVETSNPPSGGRERWGQDNFDRENRVHLHLPGQDGDAGGGRHIPRGRQRAASGVGHPLRIGTSMLAPHTLLRSLSHTHMHTHSLEPRTHKNAPSCSLSLSHTHTLSLALSLSMSLSYTHSLLLSPPQVLASDAADDLRRRVLPRLALQHSYSLSLCLAHARTHTLAFMRE